ncbi:MAG: hypothetical protein HDS93_02225 [Bacteroidales bacterium]|nr:hypothetical protein [Bacteroidales bacterium]
MKKLYFFIAAIMLAVNAMAAPAEQLYLFGEAAEGWDPTKGTPMEKVEDGVFKIEVELDGTKFFGFVTDLATSDGDWGYVNARRYGATEGNAVPETGDNEMLFPSENSWSLPEGSYTLTVDTNNNILNVAGKIVIDTNLYLRGDMNEWGTTTPMTTTDDKIYTITLASIKAGEGFKIANDGWSVQYSTGNASMTNGVYTINGDANMGFYLDMTDVTLTLDTENNTLTVSGTTSVPDLVPDALYILGNVNGSSWGTGDDMVEMTKEGKKFSVVDVEIDGDGNFSFAAVKGEGWDAVNGGNRFGPVNDESRDLTVGTPSDMCIFFGGANAGSATSWHVTPGLYDITADFENLTVNVEPSVKVGIESIEAEDANAPVEYFNIQGIRVVAPEKGIYIERRGAAARKVVID